MSKIPAQKSIKRAFQAVGLFRALTRSVIDRLFDAHLFVIRVRSGITADGAEFNDNMLRANRVTSRTGNSGNLNPPKRRSAAILALAGQSFRDQYHWTKENCRLQTVDRP